MSSLGSKAPPPQVEDGGATRSQVEVGGAPSPTEGTSSGSSSSLSSSLPLSLDTGFGGGGGIDNFNFEGMTGLTGLVMGPGGDGFGDNDDDEDDDQDVCVEPADDGEPPGISVEECAGLLRVKGLDILYM